MEISKYFFPIQYSFWRYDTNTFSATRLINIVFFFHRLQLQTRKLHNKFFFLEKVKHCVSCFISTMKLTLLSQNLCSLCPRCSPLTWPLWFEYVGSSSWHFRSSATYMELTAGMFLACKLVKDSSRFSKVKTKWQHCCMGKIYLVMGSLTKWPKQFRKVVFSCQCAVLHLFWIFSSPVKFAQSNASEYGS